MDDKKQSLPTRPGHRHWEAAKNVTGEDIPPCSVVMVTCYEDGAFVVDKCNEDDMVTGIAFTGDVTILKDSYGLITFPFLPNWVCYDLEEYGSDAAGSESEFNDAPPACGEEWGTQAGSFFIHKTNKGLLILSPPRVIGPNESDSTTAGAAAVLVIPAAGAGEEFDFVTGVCPVTDDTIDSDSSDSVA